MNEPLLSPELSIGIVLIVTELILSAVLGGVLYLFRTLCQMRRELIRVHLNLSGNSIRVAAATEALEKLETRLDKRLTEHLALIRHQLHGS